ncbi:hypothetical protein TRIATDRAFT_291671 [Trichoderma atroviride IMI 206040]|uniref:Uncharacterized protein n=1 Tax=Hypocrea atroviridis (strain ATCC 20476 / IMI 206040) TaxID=452589 RepID=G9NSV8_HYPAI|nr:uncharacterized protein TRIATDRAFT_291671 [Trichoderma atroviride IMI 206040]EHK46502.1 hypothetical protein TRIATDRAFT_291671 [Trichoderma atroviride IMI 206040]
MVKKRLECMDAYIVMPSYPVDDVRYIEKTKGEGGNGRALNPRAKPHVKQWHLAQKRSLCRYWHMLIHFALWFSAFHGRICDFTPAEIFRQTWV